MISDEYDASKDLAGSLDVGYSAIRERMAKGGPGWSPQFTPQAISFVVPGVPVPWARAGSKNGIRFTPAKQRVHMLAVQTMARAAMGSMKPFTGAVMLSVDAAWTVPASWSDKKRSEALWKWRPGRPDCDNLGKIIADSLNGIAYLDDAQIVQMTISKQYGSRAELAVRVEAVR